MSRRSTKEFFNAYAEDFSDLYGRPRGLIQSVINTLFRKSMKERFERTLQECTPLDGRRVLDLGCGPGHYAVEMAKAGAADVVGLDFAERMIALADQRAEDAGVTDRCQFICADIMTFPVERPFDYTIAMGLTDYVADIGPLLKRIAQITSGKAVLSFPKAGGFLAWQRRLRYRNRCDLYLYSRPRLEKMLAELQSNVRGVTNTRIEPIGRDYFVVIEFDGKSVTS